MIGPMLEVRGVRLGGGTPAVIVPLTGADTAALVAQAAAVRAAAPDLVEWRVDLVDLVGASAQRAAADLDALVSIGRQVVEGLDGLPLLVTIRTVAEGGRASAEPEAYLATLAALVGAGIADLVDVEVMLGEETVRRAVRLAHDVGVPVVASNHDVRATPAREELLRRLRLMVELGADVLKIAVTPLDAGDVLELLAATWAASRTLDRPVIAISMGELGVVTRLAGGVFGSAATFATVGPASAPGQRDIAQVRAALALFEPAPGEPGAGTGRRGAGRRPAVSRPAAPLRGPAVVLCGPMGSGKSAVGGVLARRWHVRCATPTTTSSRPPGTASQRSSPSRARTPSATSSTSVLVEALAVHDGVLALGGGAVLREDSRAALAEYVAGGGHVVFLDVDVDAVMGRVGRDASRPLLAGEPRERWSALAAQRRPLYLAVSTLRVRTGGRTLAQVASDIEHRLARARRLNPGAGVAGRPAGRGDRRRAGLANVLSALGQVGLGWSLAGC